MDRHVSSERAERLESLFAEAVELDTEARPGYLERVCGDDPQLRREVQSLLFAFDAHASSVRQMFRRLPLASPTPAENDLEGTAQATLGLIGRQIGGHGRESDSKPTWWPSTPRTRQTSA